MQTLWWYDSPAITAQCRIADRLREAACDHRIAVAPRSPSWQLLAMIGRRCVQVGEWLQRHARTTDRTMPALAEERVSW
jgi:hypothetical protein